MGILSDNKPKELMVICETCLKYARTEYVPAFNSSAGNGDAFLVTCHNQTRLVDVWEPQRHSKGPLVWANLHDAFGDLEGARQAYRDEIQKLQQRLEALARVNKTCPRTP